MSLSTATEPLHMKSNTCLQCMVEPLQGYLAHKKPTPHPGPP